MAQISSCTATTVSQPTLTLEGARIAIAAAEKRAIEIGVPMNIALYTSHLHLLAFISMPGSKLTSIAIAQDKAYTAAGHRIPTSAYKDNVYPGGAAFGINHSNGGRFCTIGGGVPIVDQKGNVLGAIGCSTGTPAQDEDCARKGAKAVLEQLKFEAEGESLDGVEGEGMDMEVEVEDVRKGRGRSFERELTAQEHVRRYRAEVTPPPETYIRKQITVL